jgi:hypothetical protein
MKQDEFRRNCPACASSETVEFCSGVVSPWIIELTQIKMPSGLKVRECNSCRTVFSDRGYPSEVMERLYKGYRGSSYQIIRQSWEPGYTSELNTALNGGPEWMEQRQRDVLTSLAMAGIEDGEIETCVDFGGGHGGVIPNFPHRYVYEENSQVKNSPNLQVLEQWGQVRELKPDLVMCCGVLEHMNNPKELVELIKTAGAKYYYFEVPAGRPAKKVGIFSNQKVLNQITNSKNMWRTIQRLERIIAKNKLRKFFPFRISEHLQFFSELGIRNLINNSGLRVTMITTQDHNNGLVGSKNIAFERAIVIVAHS